MADFAKLLNDKMKRAALASRAGERMDGQYTREAESAPDHPAEAPQRPAASPPERHQAPVVEQEPNKKTPDRRGSNTNRVTVNLFDADRRALAIIKEHLSNSGHDFTNRSDSIKIALRLAATAKREDLARLLLEVRAEDRRFSGVE